MESLRRLTDWRFNTDDQDRYQARYWRCPARLVTGGTWAALWREPGTLRGGGTLTSILPVLALHTWVADGPNNDWTRWQVFSQRRLCRLSGLATQSVSDALQDLERVGWLERRPATRFGRAGGRPPDEYRLSRSLYPAEGETWHQLRGSLFYGGLWSLLPTPAARHLLVTIRGLEPVISEQALLNWEADLEVPLDDDEPPGIVERTRSRHPMSFAVLSTSSGMSLSTVRNALRVLLTPLNDDPMGSATLESGPAGGSRWYTANERTLNCQWEPAVLNDANRRRKVQRRLWGHSSRHAEPKSAIARSGSEIGVLLNRTKGAVV